MIEKKCFCSIYCDEEKWLQKFLTGFACLLLYTKICLGLWPYIKNWSYVGNFSSCVLQISHNSFPDKKSQSGKCGETSRTWNLWRIKLNKWWKKLFCLWPLGKNFFAFDKIWKKCIFKLAIEKKSLITKKNHSLPPPLVWNGLPLSFCGLLGSHKAGMLPIGPLTHHKNWLHFRPERTPLPFMNHPQAG